MDVLIFNQINSFLWYDNILWKKRKQNVFFSTILKKRRFAVHWNVGQKSIIRPFIINFRFLIIWSYGHSLT